MDIISKYKETRQKLFSEADVFPKSKYIEVEGANKVHYLEIGSGSPLIIVHGGLSHSSEWINILKPLSEKFHMYIIDRPGHGLSDTMDYTKVEFRKSAVDFIKSFMDAVGISAAHFLANSIGGFFSLVFGLNHPEKINKMVLIGAPAGLNLYIPPVLRLMGIKGINRFLQKTIARPSTTRLKLIHQEILLANPESLSDLYYEHTYLNTVLPGNALSQRTMLENILTLKGWNDKYRLNDELYQISFPVSFIWGDQDVYQSPESGKIQAQKIQHHSFHLIKNAGHCPWLDKPTECVELICKYLDN